VKKLEEQVGSNIPKSQRMFGKIVYWVAIITAIGALLVPALILTNPANNTLNPNVVFTAVFEGQSPDEIWGYSTGGEFPGWVYFLRNLSLADSWAMIVVVIGCAFGLFGLVPAVIYQAVKEKDRFCATLGVVIIALICLSAAGLLSI